MSVQSVQSGLCAQHPLIELLFSLFVYFVYGNGMGMESLHLLLTLGKCVARLCISFHLIYFVYFSLCGKMKNRCARAADRRLLLCSPGVVYSVRVLIRSVGVMGCRLQKHIANMRVLSVLVVLAFVAAANAAAGLRAGEGCTALKGECLASNACSGGIQQTKLCPGSSVCCINKCKLQEGGVCSTSCSGRTGMYWVVSCCCLLPAVCCLLFASCLPRD